MNAKAELEAPSLPRALRVALFAIGVLPWIVPFVHAHATLVGSLLDRLFVPVCHRLPERTLTIDGVLMPICSRCAGIFAGFAAGALVARPRLSLRAWKWSVLATAALMALDVILQDTGVHAVSHPIRLATGFLFGYASAVAVVSALAPEWL